MRKDGIRLILEIHRSSRIYLNWISVIWSLFGSKESQAVDPFIVWKLWRQCDW